MQASIVVEILQHLTEASAILATGRQAPGDWGHISALITICEIKLRVHSGLEYIQIPIENDLTPAICEKDPIDNSANPL